MVVLLAKFIALGSKLAGCYRSINNCSKSSRASKLSGIRYNAIMVLHTMILY